MQSINVGITLNNMSDQNDGNITNATVISLDQLEKSEKPEAEPLSPEREDEQSVSGTMPDPESDDDTLKNAQQVGMQAGESTQHPEELDIARDIDKGESYNNTH